MLKRRLLGKPLDDVLRLVSKRAAVSFISDTECRTLNVRKVAISLSLSLSFSSPEKSLLQVANVTDASIRTILESAYRIRRMHLDEYLYLKIRKST